MSKAPLTDRPGRLGLLTWDGVTLSIVDWAARLGCTKEAIYYRLRKYGRDDPRTYAPPSKRHQTRKDTRPSVDHVRIARGRDWKDYSVTTSDDREARLEVVRMYIDGFDDDDGNRVPGFPWLGSDHPCLLPESRAVIASMVRVLGRLSQEEMALVFGVRRQRIDQIESAALKRCKLAGGAALREAHEYAEANRATSMGEWMEQGAIGEWGAA